MKKSFCLLSFLWCLSVFSAEITFAKKAPAIDGSGSDPVWLECSWNSGFSIYKTHAAPQADTRFKLAYDRDNLYFLLEAFEPSMKNLVVKDTRRSSESFWLNDTLEIIMVHDPALQFYHKILVTPDGKIQEVNLGDDNTGRNIYTAFFQWRSYAAVKTKCLADRWTVECAVPIASLDPGKKMKWRFNINRNRHAGKAMEISSWAKVDGSSQPAAYPEFSLPEIDPSEFQFAVDNIDGKTRLNLNKKIVHEVSADLINRTGNFRIAEVRYELLDQDFQCLSSSDRQVEIGRAHV